MSDKLVLRKRQKQKIFNEFMKGDHVLLHLDSRHSGVIVPLNLKDNPGLTLKLSYKFQGQTSQNETGISSYLRFGDQYFECIVPWEAIWGMTSSEKNNPDAGNKVWPEDIPRELVLNKLKELGKGIFTRKKNDKNARDPELPNPDKTDPLPSGGSRKIPHLKRVK